MTIDAGTNAELTALRARVAELESDNARLVQCLDDFGQHKITCHLSRAAIDGYVIPCFCSCGLDAARQRKEAKP